MRGLLHALLHGAELVRLQEAVSLESRVEVVRNAIWERNRNQLDDGSRWIPVDVFEDHAIVRRGQQLLQVPYTLNAEGGPEFGEAVRVEVEYRRMQESFNVAAARLVEASGDAPAGLEWEVDIIAPGQSLNGLYYPAETLREAAPLFEGAHVYVFDDSPTGHMASAEQKPQGQMAGWIDGIVVRAGGALGGRLHFLQEGVGETTRKKLVDAWGRGKRDLFGLSIDARGTVRQATQDGKQTRLVESIRQVLSVDVVLRPAAGGKFTRLVASAAANPHEEDSMPKWMLRLVRILESRRPTALAGVDRENVTREQLVAIATDAELQEAMRDEEPGTQPIQAGAGAGGSTAAPSRAEIVETRLLVRERLQESRLPDLAQRRIRERLDGQVLTEAQIQAAIDGEREYLAGLNPARPQGAGAAAAGGGSGTDVQVGVGRLDRLQAAFDRACGIEPENAELRTIRPLGLRALYNEITLGHDPDVTGILHESAQREMLQEAFTNATLPRVVANTLNRRMARDYREVDYGERRLISTIGSATDFRTQEAVRVGYFGDLSDVDPESGDYAELAAYGDESATYSVGQKGNIVTVTRRHIINDDIGHVAKVVGRLGRAARRTFAKFVWSFFKNNPNIYDATAWFTVAHGNLLSVALTAGALDAAEAALFNQTELSSGEKLGLTPHILAVPIQLKPTALALNNSQLVPGSANNDANPWYQRFGEKAENIIVNPFLTDANDWGVFANPSEVDVLEIKFLNGQEEPELFLADNPTVGQMFTADKLQYKIRHEYGGAVTDYRGAVKSVVA
ncbi:MAG TPA: hypothetical protein VF615_25595 [Longimicrobiaceae bacterium]